MPEIVVKDINNKETGKMSLSDEIFGIDGQDSLMHSSVVNYLANQRQGTHSTKTRGMVRGGGAKPWKQKGTGRARAGTNTSPIWRGGGTVFGPSPRDYSYKMPRKARRKAFYAALSAKIDDGEVTILESFSVDEPKTKKMVAVLDGLGFAKGNVLVIVSEFDSNTALAMRNIPTANMRLASDVNIFDVLTHNNILITKDAVQALQGRAEQ